MKGQKIHILTSGGCTNNCIFCMDDKNSRKFIKIEEAKKELLEGLLYSKEVTFTGGEPTLHPDIIKMIIYAKSIGYKVIQVISNGVKYNNKDFINNLIIAGVTDFIVSIHGFNKVLHESIVRKRNTFSNLLKGFINLSKLKNKYNKLITNTTIIKQNYKYIRRIIQFLERFPIDSIVFNVLIPQGEVLKNKEILIKYSLIAKELNKLGNYFNKYKNININGLPFCLLKGKEYLISSREPIKFKQDGIDILRHSENQDIKLYGKGIYKKMNGKQKAKKCKKCKYNNICEGIWISYIEIYGWSEFRPII